MNELREQIQGLIDKHDVDSYRASVGAEHSSYPSAAVTTDRILALIAEAMLSEEAVEASLWEGAADQKKEYHREIIKAGLLVTFGAAALAAAATSPGLDMGKIRLEAQVRYLKSRLISAEMRVEGVKGSGPEVVARIERIIGGIEGNMEVAAVEAERAVAQATGTTQEGASG